MKSLLFTLLCLLTLGQISYAQKLYTQKSIVEEYANNSQFIEQSVAGLNDEQKAKSSKSDIIRTIFMATGGCKGLAYQASNAEQVTTDLLAKNQMYESEYDTFIKAEQNGAGYFDLKEGDAEKLTTLSNSLTMLKGQLKANGYRITPGLENADENLKILQQFNKTYSKFAQLLDSRFVEL